MFSQECCIGDSLPCQICGVGRLVQIVWDIVSYSIICHTRATANTVIMTSTCLAHVDFLDCIFLLVFITISSLLQFIQKENVNLFLIYYIKNNVLQERNGMTDDDILKILLRWFGHEYEINV